MGVDFGGAFCARTDAFPPVVFIGETAAGPADHRDFQVAESLQYVVAVAAGIGNLGVFANPDAAVDTRAEMLGKLAEELAIDLRAGLVRTNGARRLRVVARPRQEKAEGEEGERIRVDILYLGSAYSL